jgi:hypothetical protein
MSAVLDLIMVKDGVAYPGDPVPECIQGLTVELLANLSWLPPEIVSQENLAGCAFYPPEGNDAQIDDAVQRYGDPIYTVDNDRRIVVISRSAIDMTADEIEARYRELHPVPESVTAAQARLALLNANLLDDVEAVIASMTRQAQIQWEYETIIRRDHEFVLEAQVLLGMTGRQMDDLFRAAALL